MLALLLATVAALLPAAPPPLPDHPATGRPMQPAWTYTYDWVAAENALVAVRCTVPPKGRVRCVATGLTPEGVRIVNAAKDRYAPLP